MATDCSRDYSFLDVEEIQFCIVNSIPVIVNGIPVDDFEDHLLDCAACRERIGHLMPEDIRDMRDYYARYASLQVPAPAPVVEETGRKLKKTLTIPKSVTLV